MQGRVHIWDSGNIIADIGTETVYYIRVLTLIYAKKGETKIYYRFNGHGDVIALANSSGAIIKRYKYDSFGVEENPGIFDTNAFRYCGEYYDVETKTIYLRARYYDAETGRFTQQDGWEYAELGDILSLNLYTYCWNNPIKYIDPDGNSIALGAAVTAGTIKLLKALAIGIAAYEGIKIAVGVGALLGDKIRNEHIYDVGTIAIPGIESFPRFYEPKAINKENVLSKENITVASRDIATDRTDDGEREVYYLAYAPNRNSDLVLIGNPYTLKEMLALNILEKFYEYFSDNNISPSSKKYFGIYTKENYDALALATVCGFSRCDEFGNPKEDLHGTGYYYHYHIGESGYHLWYGDRVY